MSAATPCPEPLCRLPADPRVALFALVYPSVSEPGVHHDTTLLALDSGPAWECSCKSANEGGADACKHISDARNRWVRLGRHDWMRRPRLSPYAFCRSCMAVRQADGHIDAAPCRRSQAGPPGISLRSDPERARDRRS